MPKIHQSRFPLDGEVANLLSTSYELLTDLLWGNHGETGVMDFGLYPSILVKQKDGLHRGAESHDPRNLCRCPTMHLTPP